jgi:predicted DNA-binding transcriptional regulator YafY
MSAGRLLTLLSLLQTPREWPGSELARRLEVSPRTVRRDVDRLRELGYPVEATMGAEGGYRLVAGSALPPLLLDDEEAVAITVGLRTAAGQPVAGIEEAAVRALTKLERVLPARLRYRVSALNAATTPVIMGGQPVVDPSQLTGIAAAITNHERLRFAYESSWSNGGAESRRHTEPNRLVSAGRRWYLVAYDVERDDWRLFRVDRITNAFATGARFTPRELPESDAAAFVTSKLYSLAPTYDAVVTVHLPAAAVPAQLGEVEPIDEHRSLVRAGADTVEWLAFRFCAAGCEFEVHEPPELVEYVAALSGRAARATQSSG